MLFTTDLKEAIRDIRIRKLHKDKPELTAQQLAEKFGLHVERIYKILKAEKITVNNPLGNRHPAYKVYKNMMDRCYNLKNPRYRNGIRVCSRWQGRNGFINFYADMGDTEKFIIQRKDEKANFEPSNCQWVRVDRI